MMEIKKEFVDKIQWFVESWDAGDPDCICSLCGKLIKEDECPIRFWRAEPEREARFHLICFEKIMKE